VLDRIAAVTLPYRVPLLIDLAREAESAGLWGVGLSDSPILYGDCYAAIPQVLGATQTIRVATNVSNPVSRHWSVHAASARTLDEVHPGRFVLGLAAGDGAVHSVGLRPATHAELEAAVGHIRINRPTSVPIHLAASGPRMAELAGRCGDAVIVATGSDATALRSLGDRARTAADADIDVWGLVYLDVIDDERRLADAQQRALPIAMSMSHFCLGATFECKNVPTDMQQVIRAGMAHYDFMHHAGAGVNPNVALFEHEPEVRDYLRNRFCIVGDREHCRARLRSMLDDGSLAGLWIALSSHDPVGVIARLAG
jgi:alkanesulfonate monooxygenase SsuD/methylene tetrahydromethanopterin reductase-like flavin-dependent oxidoreductase (luciferase family)